MSNTNPKWSALGLHCFVLLCAGSMAARSQNPPMNPSAFNHVQQLATVDQVEQSLKRCDMTPFSPYICVADSALPDTPVPVASQLPTDIGDFESLFKFQPVKIGDLTVFAPVTMTILSVDFPEPNIYANMQQGDAFKLLAASLTDNQWKALVSDQGLGPQDLNSDEQRSLWTAALRFSGNVVLHKEGDIFKPGEGIDITDKLDQVRIHLSRTMDVEIPISDNSYTMVSPPETSNKSAPPKYYIETRWQPDTGVSGFVPKQVVANVAKPSELDYSDIRFNTPVSLAAAPNLGVLITRIGLATKAELYCDKRMEKFHVSMSPAAGTARAGDILKCIALAVTGTYRRVGSAFVLTNDVMGLGTKIALLSDYNQRATNLLRTPLGEAGDKITANHSMRNLPLSSGADLDFTPEEYKEMLAQNPWADPSSSNLTLPMAELTPAQRANAQASYNQMLKNPQQFQNGKPSIDGKIMLDCRAELHMSVPGVDGDISLSNISLWSLFQESNEAQQKHYQAISDAKAAALAQSKNPAPTASAVPLTDQFRAVTPLRAIIVTPTTVDEATAIVAKAQALGFNQVFVNVFSDSSVPGAYLAGDISKTGIPMLNAAIKAAHGRGIAVFAYVDLLTWPKDTPSALRDIDIRGEDSAAESVRQQMTWANLSGPYLGPSAKDMPVSVSPLNRQVQKVLLSVHQELAEVPGLGGIVWVDVDTAGYVAHPYNNNDELGYTQPLRLAFLRKEHADPVDIAANGFYVNVDMTIPIMQLDNAAGSTLQQGWFTYRATGLNTFLRQLRATVDPPQAVPNQAKMFLVSELSGYYEGWFGSWDSPTASFPTYHQSWEDGANSAKYPNDASKQAAMESRISYANLRFWPNDDYGAMVKSARDLFKTAHWDGVVTYGENSMYWPMENHDSSIETMDKLAGSLLPQKPGEPMTISSVLSQVFDAILNSKTTKTKSTALDHKTK